LSWSGAAIGLTIHSLIAGAALAASISVEALDQHNYSLAGLAVFLGIVLHQPFDSMTLVTLMTAGGWSRPMRHLVNGLYALSVPLGAMLFFMGITHFSHDSHAFVSMALAFSAGTFLCISTSDLLPELQFHQHDRVKLSAALLLGLALAWGAATVESMVHDHDHGHHQHDDHHGHDH
jgi:zinc and cadmium transporter